ncbi:MAG: hypothetical protein AAGL29_07220 [Bacteroidota bacterium]
MEKSWKELADNFMNIVLKFLPYDKHVKVEDLFMATIVHEDVNEVARVGALVKKMEPNSPIFEKRIETLLQTGILLRFNDALDFLQKYRETSRAAAYFKNDSALTSAYLEIFQTMYFSPTYGAIITVSELLYTVKPFLSRKEYQNYNRTVGNSFVELPQYIEEDAFKLGMNSRYKPIEFELMIDPGNAPPELVAEFFAELSLLYRLMGGSGLNFSLEGIESLTMEYDGI